MSHPTPEEWVEFIENEAAPAAASRLRQHLRDCPQCRAEIAAWRRTIAALPSWQTAVPANVARLDFSRAWRPLSIAALLASAAFVVGVVVARRSGDLKSLRAEVAALRQQFAANAPSYDKQRLSAEVAALAANFARIERLYADTTNKQQKLLAAVEEGTRANRQALLAMAAENQLARDQDRADQVKMIQDSEYRQDTRLALLRQDLETVASAADDQLQVTRQNLMRISAVAKVDHYKN